jgi:hypothetical protein
MRHFDATHEGAARTTNGGETRELVILRLSMRFFT